MKLTQERLEEMYAYLADDGTIMWKEPDGKMFYQAPLGESAARLFTEKNEGGECVGVLTMEIDPEPRFIVHDPDWRP